MPRETPRNKPSPGTPERPDYEVVVIGAGLAGLYAASELKDAGIDFTILEKAGEVGGTWKVNRYPGVAVDVNSFNYAFAKVRYFEWSRAFANGAEVAKYAEHIADTFELRPHIRFHTHVEDARFDERAHMWRLSLASGGAVTARFVIHAPGGLTKPKRPTIEGLAEFEGPVMHTAEWDDTVDLRGKRVAVIGTGASAVQVVPSIAEDVAHLDVFQRTATWVMPKFDFEINERMRSAFERVPGAFALTRLLTSVPSTIFFRLGTMHAKRLPLLQRTAERIGKFKLAREVRDPALREKLTPKYGFGCKRPVVSDAFLPTFNRDNVSLVTDAIERVEARGVVTADGRLREADVIILATGFSVFELGNAPPYPVYGNAGVELGQFWHERRYQAYEACTVPGWPNSFLLTAPYGLGGASYLSMVEAATRHALRVIKEARARGATHAEVKQDAHDAYFRDILARQERGVFTGATCAGSNSYYFDRHGDAPAMRPHLAVEIELHSRFSPLSHYTFRAPLAVGAETTADTSRRAEAAATFDRISA